MAKVLSQDVTNAATEQWGRDIKACIDFLWILDNISTIFTTST